MDRNEDRKRRKEDEMSEEFKCPYCEGTASIAYHCAENNLLYCHNCKRTFSERDAKIMKQAARIAELEREIKFLKTEMTCWDSYIKELEKKVSGNE